MYAYILFSFTQEVHLRTFADQVEEIYEVFNSGLGKLLLQDFHDVLASCLSDILMLTEELNIYLSKKTNSDFLQFRYKY